MSYALLIHDDTCQRAYLYVDGSLVLDVSKAEHDWLRLVADVLAAVDEAAESEGTVSRCGAPPADLSGWTGLRPVKRYGSASLAGIVDAFSIGVFVSVFFNEEYVFGESVLFPWIWS